MAYLLLLFFHQEERKIYPPSRLRFALSYFPFIQVTCLTCHFQPLDPAGVKNIHVSSDDDGNGENHHLPNRVRSPGQQAQGLTRFPSSSETELTWDHLLPDAFDFRAYVLSSNPQPLARLFLVPSRASAYKQKNPSKNHLLGIF
jgi:hypothetical protein